MPPDEPSTMSATTSGTPDAIVRSRLNQGGVLAWAAVNAIGTRSSTTVKRVLIAQMQAFYNNVLPAVNAVLTATNPSIVADGVWGTKTAQAAIALMAVGGSHSGSLDEQLTDSGFFASFRVVSGTTRLSTESSVVAAFPAIKDSVSIFSTTAGQRDGFPIYKHGVDLVAIVRTKATAQEMALASTQYLGMLSGASDARSGTTVAQTTITRAAETPTLAPAIVPGVETPQEVTHFDIAIGEDVKGDRTNRGPNLAIILPSIAVGGILLVWLYKRRNAR